MHNAWNLFLGILMFGSLGLVGAGAVVFTAYWERKVGGNTNKGERTDMYGNKLPPKRYLN